MGKPCLHPWGSLELLETAFSTPEGRIITDSQEIGSKMASSVMFFKTLLSGEQLSSLPGAFLTEETMKLHPVGISSEWPVYWKEMSAMAHMLYWLKQKW